MKVKNLKLVAKTKDDISVLSAHLQDSIVNVSDIAKLEKDLDAALVKETEDMREVASSAMDRDVNRRLLEIIKESGVNLHEGAQGIKIHYDIARKAYMEGLTDGLNKD